MHLPLRQFFYWLKVIIRTKLREVSISNFHQKALMWVKKRPKGKDLNATQGLPALATPLLPLPALPGCKIFTPHHHVHSYERVTLIFTCGQIGKVSKKLNATQGLFHCPKSHLYAARFFSHNKFQLDGFIAKDRAGWKLQLAAGKENYPCKDSMPLKVHPLLQSQLTSYLHKLPTLSIYPLL